MRLRRGSVEGQTSGGALLVFDIPSRLAPFHGGAMHRFAVAFLLTASMGLAQSSSMTYHYDDACRCRVQDSQAADAAKEAREREERAAVAKVDRKDLIKKVRTFAVTSGDSFLLPVDLMLQELQKHKGFEELNLLAVDRPNVAQIRIEVDHVPLTFD